MGKEIFWATPFLRFVGIKQPATKPGYKLLPRDPVYSTEVVEGPRADGSFAAQRFIDGVPMGDPVEVGSISTLIEQVNEIREKEGAERK